MDTKPLTISRDGYTLLELIVALLVFAVGGLALAGTSAVMGRALNGDGVRERASRIAARQVEILVAACAGAGSGRQSVAQIESDWSVSRPDSSRISVTETVTYATANRRRTDSYRVLRSCL
jgi:prepilin-type N-terminal cleavage/methylation domain-containing protein